MDDDRRVIILVDDNPANLSMGKTILKDYYKVYPLPSAQKMFEALETVMPDLILLDVAMPEIDGYDAISRLKDDVKTQDIPVIFLTAKTDYGSELKGLSLGAVDYVSKPFSPPLLIRRIENHLTMSYQKHKLQEYNENLQLKNLEKTTQIAELQNAMLSTIADLVEFRDEVTGGHNMRTQIYLEKLVKRLLAEGIYRESMATWDLSFLIPSASLHDIGKIGIKDRILNKPGRLTPEEFEEMKRHVPLGVALIDDIAKKIPHKNDLLQHARLFAAAHHEKWDGTGYPDGLKGTDIPLHGRIMAIVDVYDALISRRPYKEPLPPAQAEAIIVGERGRHFDPTLVDVFQKLAPEFAAIAEEQNDKL